MSKSLSNISGIATEKTNTTGELTPILEFDPSDGTDLLLAGAGERGSITEGIPIYASLQDTNGDDLPADTKMALELEEPTDDNRRVISEPLENIRAYRALTLQEQQNEDHVDRVKHRLKAPGFRIEDVDFLYVSLDASVQIDWANSQLTFAESYVEEV